METILLNNISLSDFKNIIGEVLDEKLKSFPKSEPKENNSGYLSRKEVSKLLKISLPTLNDWTKQGKLQSYRIGNRVLYKKSEVEQSLSTVKNLKYSREG